MPQEHEATDGPTSALSASLLKHIGTTRRRHPVTYVWAALRFPDSVIDAISCCELPVQVLVEGLLRGPVPER
jgi:hypothetical protein